MNVDGVPDSIPWPIVSNFLALIGIDVKHLTQEGITIGYKAIECKLLARDVDGHHYVDDRGEIAMHTVSVPIVRAQASD